MKFLATALSDVLIAEPTIFPDNRGHFFESYHRDKFVEHGVDLPFVQDNHSHSSRGTLRGLHYQQPHAQGKLVRAVSGEIFDVAVDIRVGSPTFKKWVGVVLSSQNNFQLWVPPGFAHGFCVMSDTADVIYKCTDIYTPECEQSIIWNDPTIGIEWPIKNPKLSSKDLNAPMLNTTLLLPEFT